MDAPRPFCCMEDHHCARIFFHYHLNYKSVRMHFFSDDAQHANERTRLGGRAGVTAGGSG